MGDPSHLKYWMTIHPSGSATCTCPDWCSQGEACKYLCALRLTIMHWTTTGAITKQFPYHFPGTRAEAEDINHCLLVWYGPYFATLVTAYSTTRLLSPIPGPTTTPPQILSSDINLTSYQPPLDPPPQPDSSVQPVQVLNNQCLFQKYAGDNAGLDNSHDSDASDESDMSSTEAMTMDLGTNSQRESNVSTLVMMKNQC